MSKNAPPPEPIPQSTVIALQAWNCNSKISNANWDNRLNEAVTVNAGDSVFVKASFIDTRGTASGNIDLAVDTVISLEYYFYWINTMSASNGPALYTAPLTEDTSYNLTQQVLVGRNISTLIEQNGLVNPANPAPAYYTIHTPGRDCSGTNINDADGLPYLLYQSAKDIPVPAQRGPVADANTINGQFEYYILAAGTTTNWEYCGVPGALGSALPPSWNFETDFFTATANPNINLDPSILLIQTPVVKYIISRPGNVNWKTIDPSIALTPLQDVYNMNQYDYYVIVNPGAWDWRPLGATDSNVGTFFQYNGGVLPIAIQYPLPLDTAFFTQAGIVYLPGTGCPVFTGTDVFNLELSADANNNYIYLSYSGSGNWVSVDGIGEFQVPGSYLYGANLDNNLFVVVHFSGGAISQVTVSGTSAVNPTVGYYDSQTPFSAINQGPPGSSGLATQLGLPINNDGTIQPYIAPTTRLDLRPVKKRWATTLKAGSYNPNQLAEKISREMSRQRIKRVNNVKNGPFPPTQSTLTVPTDNIYNSTTEAPVWASPVNPKQNTFYDSKNPAVYEYPPASDYNLPPDNLDDLPFIFVPAMNSSPLHNSDTPAIDCSGDYIFATIPHPNANGLNNLPPSTYYLNLVPLLSDVRSVSPTIPSQDIPTDGYYSILPFYSQNALTAGSPNQGNSGIFPIAFGATQTSLVYNDENNGLFSFNYLHSPILANLSSSSTAVSECTAHMYTCSASSENMAQTTFYTTLIDKKSGILLNKMEPTSFWRQLGFDVAAITTDLDNSPPGFQMTLDEFQSKTTSGFCGSSNIFNPVLKTANSADVPSVPDTEIQYLNADAVISNPPVTAYSGLVIGTQYVINALGFYEFQGDNYVQYDWRSAGGGEEARVGDVFTATSTSLLPQENADIYGGALVTFFNPSPEITKTVLQPTYFQVENTNTIDASTIPTVRDATGHYLIELTGYNSNYIDDKTKREIKAIVSSYWVSPGAFVSVPFPDSYNFFGTGAPLTLSGLKVRILDPYTNQEAVLGPNSSIYLQVNKMLTAQAVQQIPN